MAATFIADAPALALTAGTAKSTIVLTAPSTGVGRIIQFTVGCDAVATGLLKIEFLAATLTGGTTTTAPFVARMNFEGASVAPALTASSYSAEPTYTKLTNNGATAIKTMIMPLPSGPYDIEYPLGREFAIVVSTVLAVRLTSTTVSPNAYTSLAWEE